MLKILPTSFMKTHRNSKRKQGFLSALWLPGTKDIFRRGTHRNNGHSSPQAVELALTEDVSSLAEPIYRYERKFVTSCDKRELELLLKINSALFRPIYAKRAINNIYFDFPDYLLLRDGLNGCSYRYKVRIRWYGDLLGLVEKPTLEIKVKQGLVGSKYSFPLPPFRIDGSLDRAKLKDIVKQSKASENIKELFSMLRPALVNRYQREYFLSADSLYRSCLDYELEFYAVSPQASVFSKVASVCEQCILELKYSLEADNQVSLITADFPFRMTRSSKCATGMQMLGIE